MSDNGQGESMNIKNAVLWLSLIAVSAPMRAAAYVPDDLGMNLSQKEHAELREQMQALNKERLRFRLRAGPDKGFECRNAKGEFGLNRIDEKEFLRTKDGECGDLYGVILWAPIGGQILDLRGAKLGGARLVNSQLHGADLTGADLRGADLQRVFIIDSDLSGADLSGANLKRSHSQNSKFSAALGADTDFTEAGLTNVRFDKTVLRNSIFHHAQLREVWFNGSLLMGTSFLETQLEAVSFAEADLRGADLSTARVRSSDLLLVIWSGAILDKNTKLPK